MIRGRCDSSPAVVDGPPGNGSEVRVLSWRSGLLGPVNLSFWDTDRSSVRLNLPARSLVGTGIAEDPTGEHDKGLVIAAEVAIPRARFEDETKSLGKHLYGRL